MAVSKRRASKTQSNITAKYLSLGLIVFLLGTGSLAFYLLRHLGNLSNNTIQTQVLSEQAEINEENLAFLEDSSKGYQFSYPLGWKVVSLESGLELSPPTGRGKVIVSVTDGVTRIDTESQQTSENEDKYLKQVVNIINQTFEFTETQDYDKQEIKKRFLN